jgi:hypothetical protein
MRSHQSNEQGMALVIALLFTFITGSVIVSGTIMLRTNHQSSELRFRRENQAVQFARSGLTEAMSWYRRQTGQPVTDFQPLLDATATPQVLDTDDPNIGLVREFRIGSNIWGRYEVWRKDESDTDPDRLDFRRKFECQDLSLERGFSGAGNVWMVKCIGYVFVKRSATAAWDQAPNQVLATATAEGEMQRLAIQPPSQAAVCIRRGDSATINANGRVRGGLTGAGILYPTSTGTPVIGPLADNRVAGSPALSATGSYDDTTRAVFGVSRNEVRSMADLVISNPANFPDPIPPDSIVFVEGPATVTLSGGKGLNGTGIVYVEGNLTVSAGNTSNFNGLLYVTGNLTLNETTDVFGAAIVQGNLAVQGTGDYATIWYDDDVMAALRRQIGQYRWTGAFREVINRE